MHCAVIVALSCVVACATTATPAELAPPTPDRAAPPPVELAPAMRPLAFLVGEWEGTATMRIGPDAGTTAHATELAEPRLGGAVLLIEGRAVTADPGGERVVHHALGIITHDAATGAFLLRAYRADGRFVDAELRVREDGLSWELPGPHGTRVRNTLTIADDGAWNEVSEVTRDGETWTPVLEIALRRR